MSNLFSLDDFKAKEMLPKRQKDGNKGTFGKVLVIAGSAKMVGCCELAVKGALRCGAGLVTLGFPDCLYIPLTTKLTENTFLPLASKNGVLSVDALPSIYKEIEKSDVVVFGCGIGKSEATREVTRQLILNCTKPLVLDADGLNVIADDLDILKEAKCNILITPHPGEMARLLGRDIDFVEKNREEIVTAVANEFNVNVLLKGHNTLICKNDATIICVNKTGNTGLSKGGSGDLLAGMIGGFAPSLKGNLFKASCLAAFVHGLSAERASEKISEYSTLPSDCLEEIGYVIKQINESE